MLKKLPSILTLATLLFAVAFLTRKSWQGIFMSEQVDLLRVYIPVAPKLPDPAYIENSGQWYVLGHVSSGLSQYDHIEGRFEPLLADYEVYSTGVHSFTLKDDAKFSDGSPITANDVALSIKRLLIKKTSTHLPLWDYLENCDQLKSLSDECSGLRVVSDKRIDIRLTKNIESFLLQMSSPETGIWFAGDINPKTLEINATKYSGPYSVKSIDDSGFMLKRNANNPISKQFLNSPKEIQIKTLRADKVMAAVGNGELDLVVRSHNPYENSAFEKLNFDIFKSAPATLLYLHSTGKTAKDLVPQEYIQRLWEKNSDTGIVAADTFLPFDPGIALTKAEFLNELPKLSQLKQKTIRLGVPWTYLSQGFYDFLNKTGEETGFHVTVIPLSREEWSDALDTDHSPQNIDFVLGVYAASERYPAVQLRYITGNVRGPKIDLTRAETPELDKEKKEVLRDFQKELLRNQYEIPLFLARHQILYKKNLNIGAQPPSDAEVELWRVTRK